MTAIVQTSEMEHAPAQLLQTMVAAPDHDHCRYLLFQVSDEVLGIDILRIKEIIEYGGISSIPMAPLYIRGVINLRGNVVPVVDLARRLNRTPAETGKRTCIVMVEMVFDGESTDIGVVVDAVNQVQDIPEHDIEPAPPFGANIRSEFIQGMGRVEGHSIVLLDLEHVLDLDELAELGSVDMG